MTRAQEYRYLAERVRDRARQADINLAAEWEQLARCYLLLAEQVERNEQADILTIRYCPSPIRKLRLVGNARKRRSEELAFKVTEVKVPEASGRHHMRSIIRAATQYLHNSRLCSRSLDLAHVPTVYSGHMTIVPSDRDCIPTHFGDNAAVIGIASPINAVAFLEAFRFGGLHRHLLIVPSHRQMSF